jgi:hypothetical protein
VAETGEPYAYTGDNPVNATDPLGLKKIKSPIRDKIKRALCVAGLVGCVAGGGIGAGIKGKAVPDLPQDEGIPVVVMPEPSKNPVRKLGPRDSSGGSYAGQVTVTPSAEQNQVNAPLVSSSTLSDLGRTGASITFVGVVLWALKGLRSGDVPAG